MKINRILCVCTGNICRSPLAEGLIRNYAPSVEVGSAGIGAVVGGSLPSAALDIAQREGLGLESHRGRQVTSPIIRSSDLVVVMENEQKSWLLFNFPEARGRVFLLTHWGSQKDIDDPYRLGADVFERVFCEIDEAVGSWMKRIGAAEREQVG